MGHMATKTRAALAVAFIGMSAASLFFGQDPDPCREAYLNSGLTRQQLAFDDFRHSYSETLCARDGHDLRAAGETR